MPVGELALSRPGETRLVWYVYSIGDHVTANPYAAKFWEAYYTVTGRRVAGRLDVVTTSSPGDAPAARLRLAALIAVEAG